VGNRGELFGTVRIGNAQYKIDFWDVYGVYVLLENFRAVYVGKASRKLLGPRLRDHLTDRFAGRWDMFSWFALSSVRKVQRNVRKPGKRQVTPPILNHKALVDIISMIKHAAKEEQPLYTASERVEQGFEKVAAGKTFTLEQRQWVDRIKAHLVENLSIDKEDFDTLPVFSRAGGWARANRAFGSQLPRLIQEFNEAIAA
jgi:hypothetical protein